MRFLPLFAAIFAITPLAIDMYLPAMPKIAETLVTSIATIQNSLSIYLAGYAAGMFLFGPLADRFGRRPMVLWGLAGFALFSGLLVSSQDADQFLLLRFLQAMAGAAATVAIPGAIRELFGQDTAKGMSYVSMIMMLAPMLAPAIGGYLLLLDDWPIIFTVLAAYALIMWFFAIGFFPKPAAKDSSHEVSKMAFFSRYKRVLSAKQSQGYLLVSVSASIIFFTYITSVSFLYIQVLGFNEQEFSLLFGLNVAAMIIASFINTRAVPKLGSLKILPIAAKIALLGAGVFSLLIVFSAPAYLLVASLIVLIASTIVVAANSDALILLASGQQAGTATAVIGTLRFGSGALAGPLLAISFDGSAMPIGILLVLVAVGLNFFVFNVLRTKERQTS